MKLSRLVLIGFLSLGLGGLNACTYQKSGILPLGTSEAKGVDEALEQENENGEVPIVEDAIEPTEEAGKAEDSGTKPSAAVEAPEPAGPGPIVKNFIPMAGGPNPVDSAVMVFFQEAVVTKVGELTAITDPNSPISLKDKITGAEVPNVYVQQTDANELTLSNGAGYNPKLQPGTEYVVTVKSGKALVDPEGDPMEKDYTWSFTTMPTANQVISIANTSPANGDVTPNKKYVSVMFYDQGIKGITAGSLSITPAVKVTGVEESPDYPGTYFFALETTLNVKQAYTFVLKHDGIEGISNGKKMVTDYQWSTKVQTAP